MAKLPSFCLLLPWVFSAYHMMPSRAAGTSPCLCPVSTDGIHHGELSLRSVVAAGGGDVRPSTWRHCIPIPWSHVPPSLDDAPQESVFILYLSLKENIQVSPSGTLLHSPFPHNLCFIWQSPYLPCRPQPHSRHRKTGSHLTLRPTASTQPDPEGLPGSSVSK